VECAVSPDEIATFLRARKAGRAPGDDSIPNNFLKVMGSPLTTAVARIATAYWTMGHYLMRFRHARTIVLRKQGKASYESPGAWRPIALLNTIGKLIEAAMTKHIQDAAEQHGLFPDTQMGACTNRLMKTALELLMEQVRTVWKLLRHVATLLSLDIIGAFDRVHPIRLLDILRRKGLPG
jgi:hypothetical protein